MSSADLIRLGGLAAIAGGLLRGVAAFVPGTAPLATREPLYICTDICILFGLMGLYARIHRETGWCGFLGFVLGVVGIGVILAPDATIGGIPVYPVRALTFLVGSNLIAADSWKQSLVPRWILGGWILSTMLGIAGFGTGLGALIVVAGVIFAISFSAAGVTLWSSHPEPEPKRGAMPVS